MYIKPKPGSEFAPTWKREYNHEHYERARQREAEEAAAATRARNARFANQTNGSESDKDRIIAEQALEIERLKRGRNG